jgi:metal-dependent amidase/aminoacylase/carboxypeptidase family protein
MAACDKFTINVKGKGGHGAAPQGTVDAIVEAAAVVTALQTIVSRNMVCVSRHGYPHTPITPLSD